MKSEFEEEMYASIVNKMNMTSLLYADQGVTHELSCRICMQSDLLDQLMAPCLCAGSIKYVHEECLKAWLLSKGNVGENKCELCNFEFCMDFEVGYKCAVRSICHDKSGYLSLVPMIVILECLIMGIIALIGRKIGKEKNGEDEYLKMFVLLTGLCMFILTVVLVYVLIRMCIKSRLKYWRIFDAKEKEIKDEEEEEHYEHLEEVLEEKESNVIDFNKEDKVQFGRHALNIAEIPINRKKGRGKENFSLISENEEERGKKEDWNIRRGADGTENEHC